MDTIKLKSGITIPVIGLGTFSLSSDNFDATIHQACELGYQLFDTATGYENHHQLAHALQSQQKIKPLICTKINNGDLIKHKNAENVINHILAELNINHIDFLLLHNPKVENFVEVFNELISLKKNKVINSIGVSNFTIKHLDQLDSLIEHVDINQVELHPYLTQEKLMRYCKDRNIKVMAYRPFGYGSPELLNDSILTSIAKKYEKTVSQVILKWITQSGHIAIPKASTPHHLKQNIDIFDFELSKSEIEKINYLDKGLRTCTGPWAEFDE